MLLIAERCLDVAMPVKLLKHLHGDLVACQCCEGMAGNVHGEFAFDPCEGGYGA